jgi:MSHA pilin protein MshC
VAIKQQKKEPKGSFFYSGQTGFSLIELVTVALIASILAVVAIPRLTRGSFDDARLFDETEAALRYAQRTALATQRTVCVYISASSVTLRYRSSYGDTSCDPGSDAPLPAPGAVNGAATYTVTRQGNATISPASLNFYYDRVGRATFSPAASTKTLTIGTRTMTIESESGYVH